jgi:hypothetical protein
VAPGLAAVHYIESSHGIDIEDLDDGTAIRR